MAEKQKKTFLYNIATLILTSIATAVVMCSTLKEAYTNFVFNFDD